MSRARRLLPAVLAVLLAAAALVAAPAPPLAAQEADPTAFVRRAYQGLLGRDPDPAGLAHWAAVAARPGGTNAVLHQLVASDEHRTRVVDSAFRRRLGRSADAAAVAYFSRLGLTPRELDAALLGSAEYLSLAGGTPEAFLSRVWQDVLGRPLDQGGRDLFLPRLASGTSREAVAMALLASGEGRRAVPASGARLLEADPAPTSRVATLDSVTVVLDRPVRIPPTTALVTVGGRLVGAALEPGDFPDQVVVTPSIDALSFPSGSEQLVRILGLSDDGTTVGTFDLTFTWVVPNLSLGSGRTGPEVLALQQRLDSLGYWLGRPDGRYGQLTLQAVMAFQKVEGLPRTGTADAETRRRLVVAGRPRARSTSGDLVEIDKARQVILVVRGGQVVHTFNTSTGTERPYTYQGQTLLADTPPGRWRVFSAVDAVQEGPLGRLYRPRYFHRDGIAVHGSPSIPGYPASHGCARMTNEATDFVWGANLMPIGSAVWVY